MNYQISDLSIADMALIGEALDLLPHGRVQQLVAKIQPQISEQETAERDKIASEQSAAIEAWREAERSKLKAELAKSIKSKKGRN